MGSYMEHIVRPEGLPEPDFKEICRYLGYRGFTPESIDDRVTKEIELCVKELQKASEPRGIYKIYELSQSEDIEKSADIDCSANNEKIVKYNIIGNGILTIPSEKLYINLEGCTKVALLAATIGIGADRLIRRAEVTDMLKASIYQAAGAALIEAYVNMINDEITREAAKMDMETRPRFSPGFGDVPISYQADFERLLEMHKKTGITLTDSFIMMPTKSVTAFVGMKNVSSMEI